MIASILLAAALAGELAPEAAPAPIPPASKDSRLDAPMTLNIKDAALVETLEKLADLLGVTPILEPGVNGRISLYLQEVPVSKAITAIEVASGVEVIISGKVLRARLKSGNTKGGDAPPLSSRPMGVVGDFLRFWLEGDEGRPVAVRVPSYVGRVDLPGCTEPVTIAPLGETGEKAFGIAVAGRDGPRGRPMARILIGAEAEGRKLLLPGCDTKLVVEGGDAVASAGIVEARRVEKGEPIVAAMRLVEVTEEREEVLSESRIAFLADAGWSIRSGWVAAEPNRQEQEIEVHGAALAVCPQQECVLLAVFAQVGRRGAVADGGPLLSARRAESFLLKMGRPVRWTVDSTWDGGRAALVLEIKLEKASAAPR